MKITIESKLISNMWNQYKNQILTRILMLIFGGFDKQINVKLPFMLS